MIVDIHCHSSSKPFLSGRPQPKKNIFERYKFAKSFILGEVLESLTTMRNNTQSNFDNLYAGGVRVAIVSITPVERAFLIFRKSNFATKIIKLLSKHKVIQALTGFDPQNIAYIEKDIQDYYTECFLPEYNWLCSFNNVKSPQLGYKVKFPKNYSELASNLNDSKVLNILISVEGAHAFGAAPTESQLADNKNPYRLSSAQIQTMVNNIKAMQQMPIPIFCVGVFHHFWNGLGGHSSSLAGMVNNLVDQSQGKNLGLNDDGVTILKALAKASSGNRPMLIDIKHMSAQCRKEFYALRANDSNLKNSPIICSHSGVNMHYKSLKDWAANGDNEIEAKSYLHAFLKSVQNNAPFNTRNSFLEKLRHCLKISFQ